MTHLGGIGLGTFPFSNVFSLVSHAEAQRIVDTFLELGGKYIQTAPYYEGVDSLVGKIISPVERQNLCLSTLCVKNRQGIRTAQYRSIIAQCEDSLQQLGVSYLDIYMTSTTKATDAPPEETITAMHDLQQQGKIREIGVCNVTLEQLKQYNENGHIKYVQNRFSLLCQSNTQDFDQYCREHNIRLIPYNVIEHGLLTDKILHGIDLREGDLRKSLPHFRSDAIAVIQTWATSYLYPLAKSRGISIEVLALWWALQQPNVTVCAVGATKVEQVEKNFQALKISDGSELLTRINQAYQVLADEIQSKHAMGVQEFLGNVYDMTRLNRY